MRHLLLVLPIALVACSSSPAPEATADKAAPGASVAPTPAPAPAAPTDPFLDKAATEPGAVKTSSGLVYKDIKKGTGPSPKATDMVTVNYRGTLTNGTEFDSSYKRNMPASFPLNGVIPCWTEGVQMMKVGGKAQLVCPAAIAYGPASPSPLIPPNSTLVFEVELLSIGG
jgi:FKBP-type peptidyl-prolyl cis-trans isomerase FkpA